jgi:hypothetical protein
MVTAPVRRVIWPRSARIIRSIYPPIDLFEDIADPADWEALASAEAKFNPRIRDSIGDLAKVPVARRVTGPGASWVMAPFVHCSPLRPGRFSDGTFGLYYAGDSTEVAIAETIHHHTKTMLATAEAPGWTSQFRELIGSVDADLDDVSGMADLLHPDDYTASQAFGAQRRDRRVERDHMAERPLPWRPVHRSVLAGRGADPDPRGAFCLSLEWGARSIMSNGWIQGTF